MGAESFDEFFSYESERLIRAMYLLTGNRQEAEDLSQEAMLRVYERWSDVTRMASPTGYLYRVALNLHRRRFRRAVKSLLRGHGSAHDSVSQLDETAVRRQDVHLVLASLSKEQREILILREWLGLGAEDIGDILHVSPSTARVRLHRARALMRERLGEGYERD